MKKIISITSIIALGFSFTSCKGEAETEAKPTEGSEKSCFYSYNDGTTNFEWTAFKTSDKVGVKGGFNEITVESESFEDPKKVLESITFSMKTSSVETNDEGRNGKVAKFFFETINTPSIEGKIKSIGDNGKATISVKMNGVEVDVEGDYTLEGGDFSFTSTIDVSLWNALEGITALNAECNDLHKGKDGVSKLWSEVALSFTTSLSSDCD
jgi:polyisoprenoid-binding protein YceI